FTLQRTPPLPSYLIAFAVGDFDVVDGGKAGMKDTPVSIITTKGRAAEAAYAAKHTGAILSATEKYFGMAYPFPKLDLISYPKSTFGSAMENPGLITYTARSLLVRPDDVSPNFEQRFIGTTAHEIAHMWFGDYVTMAWWDDLWLNESFASWMGPMIAHQLRPDWEQSGWRTYQRGQAMQSDRLPSARRLRQPVTASGDVQASFDRIAYAKGQTILAMFEAWLGPEKFREGVRRYVNKHAWGNATAEDFFAALATTDDAVVPALRGFVERAGVPILDVALNCTGKPALALSQRRFAPAGVPAAAPERWAFPACFEFGDATKGREICALVKDQRQVIPLPVDTCPQWVVANRSGIGYFLPKLSPSLYAALPKARQVLANQDYVPILGDLNLLVQSGNVSYRDALPLAASQANNPDLRAARRAAEVPLQLPAALIDPAHAKNYATWVRENFGTRANTMGWLPKRGEDADALRLREILMPLVADRGADAALAKDVQRLAGQWLVDRKSLPHEARGMVLEGAARTSRGGEAVTLFDGLLAAALTGKDEDERDDALQSLGLFRDPALQARAFALALDPRLSPRDSWVPLEWALKHSESSPAAMVWLERNIDALSARVPRDYQNLWPRWASAVCTDVERAQFVAVFRKRVAGLDGAVRPYRDTLEKIDACIAAVKVQQASLNVFLAAPR
ncbi:MAG: M1 family aminopeptidase, partial [Betaproteobacteria bacterium]